MRYTKIILTPKEKAIGQLSEKEIESMEYFLQSLYHSGQIQENWNVVNTENNLMVFVTQVDVDSLDEKYDGEYVRRYKNKLESVFEISYENIGTNFYAGEVCSCVKPGLYILYAANSHLGSPVICGDCGKSIPMYKLPLNDSDGNKAAPKDYATEMGWDEMWKNIESLWFAGLADRWTERQLINPKSALSKCGRATVCNGFEKATNSRFYYFLFDADYNDKSNLQEKCPECGKSWRVHKIKDENWFFCDDCRLSTKNYWKN